MFKLFTSPSPGQAGHGAGIRSRLSQFAISGAMLLVLSGCAQDRITGPEAGLQSVGARNAGGLSVSPPVLGVIMPSPSGPIPLGELQHFTVPFVDLNNQSEFWVNHTASVDWGDGTITNGTQLAYQPTDPTQGFVYDRHVYTAPGVYTLTVTLTQLLFGTRPGSTVSQTYQYIVVYDPEAGSVTGGGTLMSPAGAYAADPSLTGRATFGFLSKYQRGAHTPSGHTRFAFNAASFTFVATSNDWLVVQGAGTDFGTARYRGQGTVNGVPGYGFMVVAYDRDRKAQFGDGDALRLKVWQLSDGTVIYDNLMGHDDAADTAQNIESGQIVIHK